MGYLFTVQFGFWLGRDRLWIRNLETIFRSVWKYFSVGACIVCKQVYNFLCLIYLFIYLFYFFVFYTERLRGVSIHILVFVNLFCEFFFFYSYYLFIMVSWGRRGEVQFWYSFMLMACNFINNEISCAFTGLLSVGECICSKNNGQPLFLLEVNFAMDIRYFSSSFYHAFMLQ